MTFPTGPDRVAAIDTMMGTKAGPAARRIYKDLMALKDQESKDMVFPAQYMFKDVPYSPDARGAGGDAGEAGEAGDDRPIPEGADLLLPAMDRNGVEYAMIGAGGEDSMARQLLTDHPDRFLASYEADPNDVMGTIRTIRRLHDEVNLRAVTFFPAGTNPQVPIDDPKMYALYAVCCELELPVFCCAGIPGPRLPFAPQRVELIDQVMYDFPELTFVTRHGCEPWQELMVKLMLKWPNLYYSTSAFSPRYYPKAIIDYANTRGADKVVYAGYFPMGLSLDRIFTELQDVPFKDEVWPKFLRHNAARVLRLDG
tara:strand:- start:26 stop:961 length:936 start_codon:yes stop_codon:yes gene_type:complete